MTDDGVAAVFDAVAEASTEIRDSFAEERGYVEGTNPTGDRRLAADVAADRRLADRLRDLDAVGTYASEERADTLDVGDGYAVAVDPLDGSSNLPTNNPVGTLVGVYDDDLPASGRSLVASGYVLFGPKTTMTVAHDGAVTEYAISEGKRHPTELNVTIPDRPELYGFGGGDDAWTDDFREFATAIRSELKLRYGGAMVADVHRILHEGGIFAYPALTDRPSGKLRHQFEANPIAHVVETAGGASSTGTESILDATPEALHARVPVHVGNDELVERLEVSLA